MRVNAIAPGPIRDTEGMARLTPTPESEAALKRKIPLGDYGEKRDIADLANSAASAMAGCITAALFLRRFVPGEIAWAHLDTWAWRDPGKPGRPKGGDALGLRAVFAALQRRYSHG